MPTLSAKEAAIELGTDARTFRKFMRSITPKDDQPGQGNRYAIESKDIKKLKKQFEDFNTKKPTKASSNGSTPHDEVVDVDDDELLDEIDLSIDDADEEVDEDDDGEPVDLAELDPDEDELLALDEDPDLEEDIEELE